MRAKASGLPAASPSRPWVKRYPAPPLGRARQNGGAQPSRSGACAFASPSRPTPAHEAVMAVEGGREEGKERRTTPQLSPELAVPASPAPAPVVRSRPLRTASRSVNASRAPRFPSSPLCPDARRRERGNARTRAVPCACARGRRARPAGTREWTLLPAAPPPGRHFVIRRARPPRDGRLESRTTKAQAQVFPMHAGQRWRLEAAAVTEYRGTRAPLPPLKGPVSVYTL